MIELKSIKFMQSVQGIHDECIIETRFIDEELGKYNSDAGLLWNWDKTLTQSADCMPCAIEKAENMITEVLCREY